MNNIKISVIIPVFQDYHRLINCLLALEKQSIARDLFEVIIVNNDKNYHTNRAELPANIILIDEPKKGSYAARNAGLRVAKGRIIAFTDSDCVPHRDWLLNASRRLESGAQRLAGKIELFKESNKVTLAEIYERAFAFDQATTAKHGSSVTANLITWKSLFEEVGLFNENLLSMGDNEWGWRANDLGYSIDYAEDVVVLHPVRGSLKCIFKKRRRISGGLATMDKKKPIFKLLGELIRGLLPPLNAALKISIKSDLTLAQKIISFAIAYILKIYQTLFRILILLGLRSPERS